MPHSKRGSTGSRSPPTHRSPGVIITRMISNSVRALPVRRRALSVRSLADSASTTPSRPRRFRAFQPNRGGSRRPVLCAVVHRVDRDRQYVKRHHMQSRGYVRRVGTDRRASPSQLSTVRCTPAFHLERRGSRPRRVEFRHRRDAVGPRPMRGSVRRRFAVREMTVSCPASSVGM